MRSFPAQRLTVSVSACFRYIVDFQFVKDFLEGTVAQSYTVAWKRDAFFKFVELYQDPATSQQLKAKVRV